MHVLLASPSPKFQPASIYGQQFLSNGPLWETWPERPQNDLEHYEVEAS